MAGGGGRKWQDRVRDYANYRDLALLYECTKFRKDKDVRIFKVIAGLFNMDNSECVAEGRGYGSSERIAESFAAEALALLLMVREGEGGSKKVVESRAEPKDGLQELSITEHSAAEAALLTLQIGKSEDGLESATELEAKPDGESYVGQLEEMCQRYNWTLPTYEHGDGHDNTVTCLCSLTATHPGGEVIGNFVAKVTSNSKKVAKALAAKDVLDGAKLFLREH